MNPYNYVQVNIREQDSWAHSDKPAQATLKAIHLIRAGIAKVSLSEPLTPMTIPAENSVAIVGAGVAGMRAAIELADLGVNVHLIEREHFVGGRVAQWGKMSMTNQTGEEIITELYQEVRNGIHPGLYRSQYHCLKRKHWKFQYPGEDTPQVC